MRFRRVASHAVLALVAFAGGALFSERVTAGGMVDGDTTYRKLAIFARVLSYVENNYVTPVETDQLIYGAIRGMLATLDPHSTFMDPEQFAAVKSEAMGEFGGVGVDVVQREGKMVVIAAHENTPARRAGIVPGDVILGVDGTPTKGMNLSEAVRRIKGAPGTEVVLLVERFRGGVIEEIALLRDRIQVSPVSGRLYGDLGYVKVRSFTERTAHDLQKVLDNLKKNGPLAGLILDLRDNPGGLLDQAVRVADMWLLSGVIVSTEGRFRTPDVERAHPKGTEPEYPVVALVNGGTASASEIVAGALQDHGRGTVVGTQTFGKGSVQTVIELEDQSALKLTIARYYTPKHRSIQGTGITPDVIVPLLPRPVPEAVAPESSGDEEPIDNQLEAALEHLRAGPKSSAQRPRREAGMRTP